MKIYPKLTLIGAGPGDADLITLRGVETLASADVVLYDALVNPEILKYAPDSVPKIYVGKRKGEHSYKQEEINDLIIHFAFQYGHVVRLKGGDPFVFGRGYEEIIHAESFNIETQVVPGISSSIGVPGFAGFPVTHRGSSESFWVLTGTVASGELLKDIELAAQTNATLVILMGLNKLEEIVQIYTKQNKTDTPVAIIQDGTLPSQKVVTGSMKTIVVQAEAEEVKAPAIILIGEVVKLHQSYKNFQKIVSVNH